MRTCWELLSYIHAKGFFAPLLSPYPERTDAQSQEINVSAEEAGGVGGEAVKPSTAYEPRLIYKDL